VIGVSEHPPISEAGAAFLASAALQKLHDEAPAGHFTTGWLIGSLHKRAFGIIILLLAVVAIAPGISIVAGLFLMIPAFQMILGRRAPVFPHRIADRPLPTRHLADLVQRAVPLLKQIERFVHPRWHTPPEPTKRAVGAFVLILSAAMVFSPIPFSNVPPAVVIAVIALGYLEGDGVLLFVALLGAVILLTIALVAVWETIRSAEWITRVL
jgi:hypothetical protein